MSQLLLLLGGDKTLHYHTLMLFNKLFVPSLNHLIDSFWYCIRMIRLLRVPWYPQEPDHPDAIPKGVYEMVQARNKQLIEEHESMVVKCLIATQEKKQLAHKLKKFEGETSDAARKRSRFEGEMMSL